MKKLLSILLAFMLAGCTTAQNSEGTYYVIDHFFISEEGDAFQAAFSQLAVDTYNWYESVEGQDGVFILHCDHYDRDLLQTWKDSGIYETVPNDELWYFVVSPNYLESIGFPLSEELRMMAESGVRVYLLPDVLSDDAATTMQAFLEEDALLGLDVPPMIDTVFQREHEIAFASYHFDGTLDSVTEGQVANPVILVATSANMKYFESESLIATGAADSYIKLTREAYETYARNLPQSMRDRKVTFEAA